MNVGELTMWLTLAAVFLTHVQMRRANHAWQESKATLQRACELQKRVDEEVSRTQAVANSTQKELSHIMTVQAEIEISKEQLAEGARLISEGYPQQAVEYLRSCGFSVNQKRKAWH